jgi:hypothetical protein
MMLEPKDARVCMLDDDVPNLAGISVVGAQSFEVRPWSRKRRGWKRERRAKESPKQTSENVT